MVLRAGVAGEGTGKVPGWAGSSHGAQTGPSWAGGSFEALGRGGMQVAWGHFGLLVVIWGPEDWGTEWDGHSISDWLRLAGP